MTISRSTFVNSRVSSHRFRLFGYLCFPQHNLPKQLKAKIFEMRVRLEQQFFQLPTSASAPPKEKCGRYEQNFKEFSDLRESYNWWSKICTCQRLVVARMIKCFLR